MIDKPHTFDAKLERYSLAADYLVRVPEKYLATLNIYKQGCDQLRNWF